ncbi:purine-binding chemotaxis protein CheW [Bacillus sp. SORGH_AS 510]|uniref:chemotaxis protein CheW n=1 Tax=Bacillus sp. SORGH_AS_0510 TaxID=3041771 RepID=UPI002789117E|nr:chemotaxis protein CheW [Bacillus sp. SORGH_AS_0510]MDQ1146309.1 purine-binding chemotaxis protein CheW [Bacillus sp. SORGH_AS_0510]
MREQAKFQDAKVLIFKIGQEEYGVHINQVVSIERMQTVEITPYPNRAPHVLGVAYIRSMVTPIVDMRAALTGQSLTQTDATRMIIVKVYDKEIGLIVDAATDVLDLPPDSVEQTNILETNNVSYLMGISKFDHRFVILLDIEKLLENTTNLDDLKEMVQNFINNKEEAEV